MIGIKGEPGTKVTKGEQRLRTLFRRWVPLLGLDAWDLTVELAPSDKMSTEVGQQFDTAAECVAVWEYQRATIRFAEPLPDDVVLENHVVHELMHVVLNELRDVPKHKNEERTAVMLTRAFLRVAA